MYVFIFIFKRLSFIILLQHPWYFNVLKLKLAFLNIKLIKEISKQNNRCIDKNNKNIVAKN